MSCRRVFLTSLAAAALAAAGAAAQDRVEFRELNTGKVTSVTGTIRQEGIAGIKIQIAGATTRDIAAARVVDVEYADLPGVLKIEYGQIQTAENMNDHAKALDGYQAIVKKIPQGTKARRHVEFRIGMLQAERATDPTRAGIARQALEQFVKDHPDSWQFPAAALTLARLQISAKDYDAAVRTLDGLAKLPGLAAEQKAEARMAAIDTLIQAGKGGEAASRIQTAMGGLQPSDPDYQRLQVLQLRTAKQSVDQQVKKLEEMIAKTEDPSLRALAYNTMGDCYADAGRNRDAMWSYLWVDVVYFQDRQEHLKAVDRLAKLFEKMNDPERAKTYREKLAQLR